jgi:hypothetical protein
MWLNGHKSKLGSHYRTPEHIAWVNMIQSCKHSKPHSKCFENGIKVHESWQGDRGFYNFLACVGKRPDGHALGRIDKKGNFVPGNVKWMSWSESNKRRVTPFKCKKGYKLYVKPEE